MSGRVIRRVISVGNSLTIARASAQGVVLSTWCDGVRGESTTPYALHLTREEAIDYANGVLYAVRDADELEREERDAAESVSVPGVHDATDRVLATH